MDDVSIAVVGGSGLYHMAALEQGDERVMDTPFGQPSDSIRIGTLSGRRVAFLARHGRNHHLVPGEIPHRANIHALRQLGVRFLVSVSAVGSLKRELPPGAIVFPDQFFDRTKRCPEASTFFGRGIVAHIGFGEPICEVLRGVGVIAARAEGASVQDGGTYVNIEGPAFSTRAESNAHRASGWDVVGMTNLAEAKLAREAEISYATMAMVTDFDCWAEEQVSVAAVIGQLHANAALAQRIVARIIPAIPLGERTKAHQALATAIFTPREHWPRARVEELQPMLGPYLAPNHT
jgi:5'-methylthioadenosine phosphorylase